MKNFSRFSKYTFPILVLISACISCGGGGSSSGSDSPVYQGIETKRTIEVSNVRDTVMDLRDAIIIPMLYERTNISPYQQAIEYSYRDEVFIVKRNQVSNNEVHLDVRFQNSKQGDVYLTGNATYKYQISSQMVDGIEQLTSIKCFATYRNLQASLNEETYTVDGTMQSTSISKEEIIANLLIKKNDEETVLKTEDIYITKSKYFDGGSYDSYELISSNGRVFNSQYGYVDFITTTPFIKNPFYFHIDDSIGYGLGTIELMDPDFNGQIISLSPEYFSVAIDSNNDGNIDKALRYNWSEINIPVTDSQVPPVANPGAPLVVSTGTSITAHALFSHDSNEEYLNFLWNAHSVPEGSTVALSGHTPPIFSFSPDVAGDYFFNLEVSDGSFSRSATLKVTARENPINRDPLLERSHYKAGIEIDNSFASNGIHTFSIHSSKWFEPEVNRYSFDSNSLDHSISQNEYTASLIDGIDFPSLHELTARSPITGSTTGYLSMGGGFFELATKFDDQEGDIIFADINEDGIEERLRIVTTNPASYGTYEARIYEKNPAGIYVLKQAIESGNHDVTLADINSDTKKDLITMDQNDIWISYQDVNGQFLSPIKISYSRCGTSYKSSNVHIGDFNGDNIPDLAFSRNCNGIRINIYQQDNTNSLSQTPITHSLVKYGSTIFKDFNGDNIVDMALLANDNNLYKYFDLAGSLTEQFISSYPLDGAVNSRQLLDINEDGLLDAIFFTVYSFYYFEQNQDKTFTGFNSQFNTAKFTTSASTAFVSDFDLDGKNDLIFKRGSLIFGALNAGNNIFEFSDFSRRNFANLDDKIIVKDYNQDGVDDIIVNNGGSYGVIYNGLHSYSTEPNAIGFE